MFWVCIVILKIIFGKWISWDNKIIGSLVKLYLKIF